MNKVILMLLLFSGTLKAQTFKITGNVKAPAFTVILFRSPDSAMVKAAITDTAGNFSLPGIGKGSYYLICRGVGFQTYQSTILSLHADLLLPTITLRPNISQLAGVTILGKKQLIEVMPDKTVFNVQNSLAATGLTALDVLRKAPGLIVDNQNNLILEGKAGVSIFIDGKRSLLSGDDLTNYLKTIQSSDIGTLEIITQPSAKYDAAGNAGIINIRLIKNKSYGTNGSVISGYAIGRYSKYNNSFTINTRTEKLNIFTSYSNSFNKNRSYLNLDRFQNRYEYDERSFDITKDHNHNIRAGLDYSLNKSSTLGIGLNGIFSGYNDVDNARTPVSFNGLKQQVLIANGFTKLNNKNLSGNLNYHYLDKKQRELTVDADYGYFTSDRNQTQPNAYYNSDETRLQSQTIYQMVTPVNIHLLAIKADYSQPVGKAKLVIGLKSSRVKTDNIFDFYSSGIYSLDRSNVFDYTENINAAYFNISQGWKKVNAQIGLRAEQTISNGELTSMQQNKNNSVKRNYTDLFPSGGITYTFNAKDNVTLSYSRRVDRPDYRSLNPFERNIDELSFSKGNPFLKPQYTDAIKLSNTYNYTLTTSLTYSYISDFFAQITDTLDHNRNFISPQNIANEQVINLGISYPFNINKWWSVYANLNAFRSIYQSANIKFVPVTQNTLSFYASNSFTLAKGYNAEISGWYSSPSIWSGSYRTNSVGSLDLAIQKTFASNRVSIRMAVSDVLYTSNWSGTTQYGALYIKGSGGYESRQFRLSLKYSFGRKEIKGQKDRRSAVEDEKGRIKN